MQEVTHTERNSEIWNHWKLGPSLNSATTSVTLDKQVLFSEPRFILCHVSRIDIRAMAWHFKDKKPGKSFQILFFNHRYQNLYSLNFFLKSKQLWLWWYSMMTALTGLPFIICLNFLKVNVEHGHTQQMQR